MKRILAISCPGLSVRASSSLVPFELGGVGRPVWIATSMFEANLTAKGLAGLTGSSMEAEKGFDESIASSGKMAATVHNSRARSSSVDSRSAMTCEARVAVSRTAVNAAVGRQSQRGSPDLHDKTKEKGETDDDM